MQIKKHRRCEAEFVEDKVNWGEEGEVSRSSSVLL